MKRSELTRREGFWRSDSNLLLPAPVPNEKPWKGQRKFLEALRKIEEVARQEKYKGYSTCRLCNCKNGSVEFYYEGWAWPEGLAHYLTLHNVRPSLAFQEFILGALVDET